MITKLVTKSKQFLAYMSQGSRYFPKQVLAVLSFLLLVVIINCLNIWISPASDLYHNIGASIIIAWVLFLISYFTWAIHFYNVNYGWTDQEWKNNEEKKAISPELAEKEPEANPHAGESLGLPPGTIRATIALSLLITGLGMTIASLGMKNTFPADSVFIDNFEFFKTAFLMMIAFYFGVKGLEVLDKRYKTAAPETPPTAGTTTGTTAPEATLPITPIVNSSTPIDESDTEEVIQNKEADVAGKVPTFHDPNAKG